MGYDIILKKSWRGDHMKYRYKKIDAFTTAHSQGNPAAVIYLEKDEAMSDAAMQAIARAHKGFVCEMVFCRHVEEREAAYALRYFSSECEIDFCGHGTIACLYSLISEDQNLRQQAALTFRTQKEQLICYNAIDEQNAIFISAPKPVYKSKVIETSRLASALGIARSQINEEGICVINGGLDTLIVPITQFETEVDMLPDRAELEAYVNAIGVDIILVYCEQVENKDCFMHTRVFSPKFGYLEDPATGSGNSAFGYYLLRRGLWQGEHVIIEQGHQREAFNAVHLLVKEDKGEKKLLFGGNGKTIIDGYYHWQDNKEEIWQ